MVDFLHISTRSPKKGTIEVYPTFSVKKSSDLMIRGGDFYAVWVEERGLWSTDEDDLVTIVDRELDRYVKENRERFDGVLKIMYMRHSDTNMIDAWHKYCQRQMRDNFHMLDEKLIFSNMETKKSDYASKRLNYPLETCDISSYEKLMSTLYTEEERHKLEWAIGAIITGDSKTIQKFVVLYGAAGTGKSTVLNIIQLLFEGYYSVFDAKALGSSNNAFALEAFKDNPLVAIQHDGDLSRIEDNTRLNSLVSHELMTVNEKFKSSYSNRFKAFLFMGTNKPVKITDAKSGLIRRLIDVSPSGNKLNQKEYFDAVSKIPFELGGIASHCRDVYLSDPNAYDGYIPMNMMGASNDFYNFVLDSYYIFNKQDGTTLKAAWEMYKTYIEDAKVPYPLSRMFFKEELKNYFKDYKERYEEPDGTVSRCGYFGFRKERFDGEVSTLEPKEEYNITFKEQPSIFDDVCSDCRAQYASKAGTPLKKWEEVQTVLSAIDTSRLHYVRLPENHIVIDFDLKDENGGKSFERNLEAASKWPKTYAELSKSGSGVHLHYIYTGDPLALSRIYDVDIEIKVFTGNSSLRRKLTKCNDLPIAKIGSGLPLKEEKKMVNFDGVMSEKALRTFIKKCLNREYHPNTKPSIDYIYKKLEEQYASGEPYDVSDMQNAILVFAANSSHQSDACLKLVSKMKFKSEEVGESVSNDEQPIVFYDVEVFPNLFLVNWKFQGANNKVVRMINPSPKEIEELMHYRLIGFNCRRYDNHMIYGCLIGYTNEQLYRLSQRIISGERNAFFGEAYNVSYTDVYDFAAKKQSLKKWEIELGLHHKELGLPWDQPVPKERWLEVAEYCDNDVIATEATFDHLKGDWTARQILADLAGMTVNDTTNTLTTRIIFGSEKHPQLVYTDLATGEASDPAFQRNDIITAFPGYEYVDGKNMFRGDDLGKGGYVYAEPGIHWNVALLDIASLHPNSIRAMNCFGKYTKNFTDILDARVFIKHKDYDSVRHMFDGRLAVYLEDESTAKDLAQALKIAINAVYGQTWAGYDNPFRDRRNNNNFVALRGALFMRTLQDEIIKRGFRPIHIKTDSVKIPNATPEIIQFCMDFATQYGYTFEHEATYERMCLVNDAVYIAKYQDGDWTATGTQFQVPYVFKTLFSHEPIEFDDLCETKSVTSALYLDMNEDKAEDEHNYIFVGKIGRFCPIKPGRGGGLLVREATDKNGNVKYDAATGSKGYRWLESEMVREFHREDDIDRSYYDALATAAIETISEFGDFEHFVSMDEDDVPPWFNPSEPWADDIEQYEMASGFDVR